MFSSRLIFNIVYLAYSFSNAQFPPEDGVSTWTTVTSTESAYIYTQSIATTETFSATTATVRYAGDYGAESLPGVSPSYITTTESAFTLTQQATTKTVSAETVTFLEAPEGLATVLVDPILYDMQSVAPDVTSLPIAMASKLNVDYESLWNSYTSKNPLPTIYSKVNSDLQAFFDSDDVTSQSVAASIFHNLILFPDPTKTASISSALSSLLAPYPSLSSEISVYMTALPVWDAPEYLAEISMIRSDLSITTPAPTWLSQVSAYLPTSTGTSAGNGTSSSSKNSAVTTRGASVLINAVIGAAGMVIIGLM